MKKLLFIILSIFATAQAGEVGPEEKKIIKEVADRSVYLSTAIGLSLCILKSKTWIPLLLDTAMKNNIKAVGYVNTCLLAGFLLGSGITIYRAQDEIEAAQQKDKRRKDV